MTNPRNCATGRRPLSGHYALNHPESCEKCSECGYWHLIKAVKPPIIDELQAVADHLAAELPPDWKRAADVRPLDTIEVVLDTPSGVVREFHTVTGFNHQDNTVELLFTDRAPAFFGMNTPVRIDRLAAKRNDEALAEAVQRVAKEDRQATAAGNDFGMQAFDWMESAIRMLKNGEWAERHPDNAMLADLETAIGDAVISGSAYHEIQPKFKAACATLEEMGFIYDVEGATRWHIYDAELKADFNSNRWERGEIDCPPPVGAKFIATGVYTDMVICGRVLGVGDENIIVKYTEQDGTTCELALELKDFNFIPYSGDKLDRAKYMAQIMNGGKPKYSNQQLKFALLVTHENDARQSEARA